MYVYSDLPTAPYHLTSMTSNAGLAPVFSHQGDGSVCSWEDASGLSCAWALDGFLSGGASTAMTLMYWDAPTSPLIVQPFVPGVVERRPEVEGSNSTTWTVSVFSSPNIFFERDQVGDTAKYPHGAGLRIARINCTAANPPTCTTRYYLGDALGSTRQVFDSGRATVFSTSYEPFGTPYSVSGTEAYTYTSERHNDPTGLVYLRARQYDRDLGRFVSADPVLGSLGAPQTLNRYAILTQRSTLPMHGPCGHTLQSSKSRSAPVGI